MPDLISEASRRHHWTNDPFFKQVAEALAHSTPVDAAKAGDSTGLPLMRAAFRTSETGPKSKLMVFSFRSIDALHAAEAEWEAFLRTPVDAAQPEVPNSSLLERLRMAAVTIGLCDDGDDLPDHTVIDFGLGMRGVSVGTYGDRPAVFIRPMATPGPIGLLSRRPDQMVPGELVLTFPTEDQARAVDDALVGALARAEKDVLDKIKSGLIEALAPAPDQTT